MRKPKILLLGKLPPPYMGPAIATQILLASSLNERYELLHVNTSAHASLSMIGRWSLKKVRTNVNTYARMWQIVRRERPDLVLIPISQSTIGFLKDSIFILMSRLFGRPTLLQLRGSNIRNWLRGASPPTRFYVERVIRSTQGVIVLGHNLRNLFADFYPADRIFVVPNGADYDFPPQRPRQPGEPLRLLYLANLLRSKGIEDVLDAVAVLKRRGAPGFVCDVVGAWLDDDLRRQCLDRIREDDLPVVVHPPTSGRAKLQFFADADVFVFPPRAPEGHPWVVVEALAAGLPVVATDRGAIVESVEDGVNGFIVEAQNPEHLADRIRRLLEDPQTRARMADASRRRYEARFTEARMVDRLSATFDAMLPAGVAHAEPLPEGYRR